MDEQVAEGWGLVDLVEGEGEWGVFGVDGLGGCSKGKGMARVLMLRSRGDRTGCCQGEDMSRSGVVMSDKAIVDAG